MKKKIFFIVNHASFFVSHRLPIAIAAKKENYEILIIFGKPSSLKTEDESIKEILKSGINFKQLNFNNQGIFRIFDLFGLMQLIYLILKHKPYIIHSISPIANFISSIAIIFFKKTPLVISISGMGYLFTDNNFFKKYLSYFYLLIFKNISKKNNLSIILQNNDDYNYFHNNYKLFDKIVLIKGSGIDLTLYKNVDFTLKKNYVVLPARLIKEKGIMEFIYSAVRIKKQIKNWKFIIIGQDDYKSPSLINLNILNFNQKESFEFRNYDKNLNKILIDASIVCLPSYREGMPKVLLEASAAGCAIITTNTIGCREAIINGYSGELIKVRDIDSLTLMILKFINNKKLRMKYGNNARKYAFKNYSINSVIKTHLNIYKNFYE